jgi:hypothetical protein
MPKSIYSKRGGVLRYRTISLGKNKYAHLAIVKKPGKYGGRTILGKIKSK